LPATETQHESNQSFPWYALWVRSRHEKSVSEILQGKGFETFLPMHTSRRRWSDRVQELELPLIPGYVFSRFDANCRLPILTTPGLVQIVSVGKMPQPVDETEMQALIMAVRSGVHLRLWPFLKSGERVSIEEGPLRSLEGVLISTKGSDQLILSISLLQRSVAVAVDRRWVRPIGKENVAVRRPVSSPIFVRERVPLGR
jgi:transcription antitermination factor NusG